MERRRVTREGAERLGQIEILADVPIGRRRELARLADEVIAAPGETIMRQGDPGYEFMMLEEGQAEVIQDGERINLLGPGDSFGELAVLADGRVRSASVVASTEVRAIVLTAHFMRELHDRLPPVGGRIDELASDRIESDAARQAGGQPT